jgi:hypothetical protein
VIFLQLCMLIIFVISGIIFGVMYVNYLF